ncbi:MAG: carboxypeptidase-like regulatory domain-containing protein [Bacteroidales bacterium]|nr:carboxypeptidase-like regulatory domain-containing protein [Bacteroidales bacterium]
MRIRALLTILFITALIFPANGQEEGNSGLIQFSGVVVAADSLNPVPFTNIIIKNTNRGTSTDYYGFFSFVAQEHDTIMFSAVGYKKSKYVIPDTITSNRYSLIKVMSPDTLTLDETVIYPWPTKEQFVQAFMDLDVPDDDLERARKNLAKAEMKERVRNYGMDGSMNYTNYMNQQTSKLYHIGQPQPISLLNPFAWAEFIKAWKNGEFKRDEKD